mgnify:CR=1 FL=1
MIMVFGGVGGGRKDMGRTWHEPGQHTPPHGKGMAIAWQFVAM